LRTKKRKADGAEGIRGQRRGSRNAKRGKGKEEKLRRKEGKKTGRAASPNRHGRRRTQTDIHQTNQKRIAKKKGRHCRRKRAANNSRREPRAEGCLQRMTGREKPLRRNKRPRKKVSVSKTGECEQAKSRKEGDLLTRAKRPAKN